MTVRLQYMLCSVEIHNHILRTGSVSRRPLVIYSLLQMFLDVSIKFH